MNAALFVLSTGRCGTQWLAAVLRRACGGRAAVEHEPLGDDYAPRLMLGARDPATLSPDAAEPILEHAAGIESILESRAYVECGHPSWSTIPWLLRRFAGRIRVLHLVRHPVPTAWSWVTERAYCPPLAPHLRERVLLSPFDAGVRFTSYRARWPSLNPYEKALFYWAEVNAFGLCAAESAGVPWMRVRFEDLAEGDALPRVLAFAGCEDPEIARPDPVDEFRFLSDFWCDPGMIAAHADVVEVARAMGYDACAFDEGSLRRRYFLNP
jgi:hypothetical protein